MQHKIIKLLGNYTIVDKKGAVVAPNALAGLLAELLIGRVEKTLMLYLHVIGALLMQHGGKIEVDNKILKQVPKYFTVSKQRKQCSVIYSLTKTT